MLFLIKSSGEKIFKLEEPGQVYDQTIPFNLITERSLKLRL